MLNKKKFSKAIEYFLESRCLSEDLLLEGPSPRQYSSAVIPSNQARCMWAPERCNKLFIFYTVRICLFLLASENDYFHYMKVFTKLYILKPAIHSIRWELLQTQHFRNGSFAMQSLLVSKNLVARLPLFAFHTFWNSLANVKRTSRIVEWSCKWSSLTLSKEREPMYPCLYSHGCFSTTNVSGR